jgi:hypothetical protein
MSTAFGHPTASTPASIPHVAAAHRQRWLSEEPRLPIDLLAQGVLKFRLLWLGEQTRASPVCSLGGAPSGAARAFRFDHAAVALRRHLFFCERMTPGRGSGGT